MVPSPPSGPFAEMNFGQIRNSLTNVIFRNRPRHSHEQMKESSRSEAVLLDDVLLSESSEQQEHGTSCFVHPVEDFLWERVTVTLHDQSDPSQTELKLFLVRHVSWCPPYRTLVLLHSTGNYSTTPQMINLASRFALRGFMVVLLSSRYHGCRAGVGFNKKERYTSELVSAWRNNGSDVNQHRYPFIYDTSADLSSVADYLVSRPDVIPASLGIAGISLGGMHAWFAAAADKRWKAVAPLIGVQSFKYAIENNCFHARVNSIREVFDSAAADEGHGVITPTIVQAVWNRICPGLLDKFDAEYSLSLLFPRPVFIGNGELDPRCPIQGVREALDNSEQECSKRWAEKGNLELHVYPGVGHEVTEDMWNDCIDFFERVFPLEESSEVSKALKPCEINVSHSSAHMGNLMSETSFAASSDTDESRKDPFFP